MIQPLLFNIYLERYLSPAARTKTTVLTAKGIPPHATWITAICQTIMSHDRMQGHGRHRINTVSARAALDQPSSTDLDAVTKLIAGSTAVTGHHRGHHRPSIGLSQHFGGLATMRIRLEFGDFLISVFHVFLKFIPRKRSAFPGLMVIFLFVRTIFFCATHINLPYLIIAIKQRFNVVTLLHANLGQLLFIEPLFQIYGFEHAPHVAFPLKEGGRGIDVDFMSKSRCTAF